LFVPDQDSIGISGRVNRFLKLETIPSELVPALPVAVAAIDRTVGRRLERKFRDRRTALRASKVQARHVKHLTHRTVVETAALLPTAALVSASPLLIATALVATALRGCVALLLVIVVEHNDKCKR